MTDMTAMTARGSRMLLKNERLKKSRTRPGAGQMADENKDWVGILKYPKTDKNKDWIEIFKLMAENFAFELI